MKILITGVAAGKLLKSHRAKVEKAAQQLAQKKSSVYAHAVDLNKSTEAIINLNVNTDVLDVQVTNVREKQA